jgi:cobalt/nickel transport system permease protein
MHIPDGYLSPSTCAILYGAATPFWYVALERVKKVLHTRAVPLLSLSAAFCFVIMMFNLPLPGGTTGHAVGMAIAAIVLGPWVAIAAVSVALLIQALFFGDGGITAFGANCFNMAVVGALVAYGVYRLISRGAEIGSTRRVLAAGIAGYGAINIAALCAAIEFGIQPLVFRTASGAPLYAPYPLSIAIPAMMIGHLTLVGLAEFVISAGIVAYLQRAAPELLRLTAPNAPLSAPQTDTAGVKQYWLASKKLWVGFALVLTVTPLGLLALGSAWGEWTIKDFSNAAARAQIAAASGQHALPRGVPSGLERWSSLWKAPFSGYQPPLVRNAYVGYLVSAAAGAGLIILLILLMSFVLSRRSTRARRKDFVERTIERFSGAMEEAVFAEHVARLPGLLQKLDARVKVTGIGALIAGAIAVHRLWNLAALFAVALLLALLSRVSLVLLAKRVWLPVLAFTGIIALPALFLVSGSAALTIPFVEWRITWPGLTSAAFLILRAETAATFCLLLVLSTRWNHLLRALHFFRTPAVVVLIVEMTYRYVFLLLRTAQDMFESRKTKLVGYLEPADQRRLAAANVGVLLAKSVQFSSEVHKAMLARGFRGEVRLLDDFEMRASDWFQLTAFVAIAVLFTWTGR